MTAAVRFFDMLDAYNRADKVGRIQIEDEIHNTYRVKKAVVALDMSGFTRTVQDLGVVFYLAMIRRLNNISREVIASTNGRIIKTDADNLTAVFVHRVLNPVLPTCRESVERGLFLLPRI